MNVKELKARLSQYLREVGSGEVSLVADRTRGVARLGPPLESAPPVVAPDLLARLLALGTRPPLREPRATDYRRSGDGAGVSTPQIAELLDEARADSR